MAEKKNAVEEKEETVSNNTGANEAATAKGKPKGGNAKKEKEGFGSKAKAWVKRNKGAIIAGVAGVGAGVAGTIGVSELGKRAAERKARKTRETVYVPTTDDHSPLDPNY